MYTLIEEITNILTCKTMQYCNNIKTTHLQNIVLAVMHIEKTNKVQQQKNIVTNIFTRLIHNPVLIIVYMFFSRSIN